MLATRYHAEIISWHRELPGEIKDLFHTDTYSIVSTKMYTRYLTIYGIDVPVEFGPPDREEIERLKRHGVILEVIWAFPNTIRKETLTLPIYSYETLQVEMRHIINEYIEVHTSERQFEQFIYTASDATGHSSASV